MLISLLISKHPLIFIEKGGFKVASHQILQVSEDANRQKSSNSSSNESQGSSNESDVLVALYPSYISSLEAIGSLWDCHSKRAGHYWSCLAIYEYHWISLDIITYTYMGVSINGGTPKWMVDKGKFHLEMDENWGYPYFRKPPCIYMYI